MSSSAPSSCSGSSLSNLQRFLQRVTPVVPSRNIPQSCIDEVNRQWQPDGKETIEYFTLKDLWECYNEWSAYGAGTNITLESGETIMQFYVPYLSSIQLYTNKSVAASKRKREDGEGSVELESDSWSDDSGSDNLSRSLSNNSSKESTWDAVSEDSSSDQDGSWSARDKLGYLYLHYSDVSSPYRRVPLMDKISELARSHPGIMTLKSVDLSPASWMAVAWYPIYSIPSLKNEKDLETCFLTYHTLSSSFQESEMEYEDGEKGKDRCSCCWEETKCEKRKSSDQCIRVSPFGLASYKMQGDIWANPASSSCDCDHERLASLHSAAESWLKQLNVHHHDFNFFTFHSYF